jgi:outer membrane immunogenic protein
MKKILLAGIAAVAFCAVPAFAADIPVKAAPYAAPVFN